MKSIFIILLQILSNHVYCQNKILFGFETGLSNDLYTFSDDKDIIAPTFLPTLSWGAYIGKELTNSHSIELGLIRKYYDEGFSINLPPPLFIGGGSGNAFDSWQIPIRLKNKLFLHKDKISFATTIGYHFCINSSFDSGGGGNFVSQNQSDTIIGNYQFYVDLNKYFSLIETKIGFNFLLLNNINLYVFSSYYTGLNKVIRVDYDYTLNSSPVNRAYSASNGNYWKIGFEVNYPISNLWIKSKK